MGTGLKVQIDGYAVTNSPSTSTCMSAWIRVRGCMYVCSVYVVCKFLHFFVHVTF
jgi:hypothetical protein